MLNKLLTHSTGNVYIQLIRYLISGGLAFAIDIALLYIFTDLVHLSYLLSAIISFTAGLIITYLLSIFWIFDNRRFDKKALEVSMFAFIGIIGLLLTTFFMWFFTDVLSVYYLLSKVFTTIIVFLWNFVMKKITLFPRKEDKN